jgi:hypothetical protein
MQFKCSGGHFGFHILAVLHFVSFGVTMLLLIPSSEKVSNTVEGGTRVGDIF